VKEYNSTVSEYTTTQRHLHHHRRAENEGTTAGEQQWLSVGEETQSSHQK